jgi:hypothetical protein
VTSHPVASLVPTSSGVALHSGIPWTSSGMTLHPLTHSGYTINP